VISSRYGSQRLELVTESVITGSGVAGFETSESVITTSEVAGFEMESVITSSEVAGFGFAPP
jgi:hypothetical protein